MRTLTICLHCRSQYDVTGRCPGESVRCHCGALVEVPHLRVQEARVVRCSNCGAARSGEGPTCDFCGSRFALSDKGWGSMCPACFCRLPEDAHFCVECGLKIHPEKLDAAGTDLQCPRCAAVLQARVLNQIEVCECGGCGGLWLSTACFESICSNKELMAEAVEGVAGLHPPVHSALAADEPIRYLRCPRCKDRMNRQNFARISAVIIDTCRDCGVWLDNQELNQILRFVETGGMQRARDYEAEERSHSIAPAPGGWTEAAALGAALSMPVDCYPLRTREESITPLLRLISRIARAILE